MNIPERIVQIYERKIFATTDLEIEKEKEYINKLSSMKIEDNTVLVIEPNDCHSECLPSYIKYFIDLGFNVDLLISQQNFNENAFINCHFEKNKFRIFPFPKVFRQPEFFVFLNNYKYVFLASLLFFGFNDTYYIKLLKEEYVEKYNKDNLFIISHEVDFGDKIGEFEEYFKEKIFALRPGIRKNSMSKDLPFIAPIYFGEYTNLIKDKKENYTKFLCVGGNYKKNLRNYDALLRSVKSLSINHADEFEVICVGYPDIEFKKKVDSENIKISFTGRITFEDLYKHIIESDFILFNIDKDSVEYDRYLTKKISGSYSLSLGFFRPGIVDEKLAEIYGLTNGAITYSYGNLYKAMEQAMKISNNEYVTLENYLKSFHNNLQQQSLENIRKAFT